MFRKMIEKIEEMSKPVEMSIHGRAYTNKPVSPVFEPVADVMDGIHTLTGLADYLETNVDALDYTDLIIQIRSHQSVSLRSGLFGPFLQRQEYLSAEADVPAIPFGSYLDVEAFNIMLQSMFIKNPGPGQNS